MLKLDSLLAFVTTAEANSISEAARRLQISKSVASERLAELERNVGATRARRQTRPRRQRGENSSHGDG
jgi:DNA-binding transcriptional LysR family regulator